MVRRRQPSVKKEGEVNSPNHSLARLDGRRWRSIYTAIVSPGACIPSWYHAIVSTQIAVRLPDELVAYVDAEVAAGRSRSRAALVARLIERDARRRRAEQDLEQLAKRGALHDEELLAIVGSVADAPVGH